MRKTVEPLHNYVSGGASAQVVGTDIQLPWWLSSPLLVFLELLVLSAPLAPGLWTPPRRARARWP
jgi:hypothetical protein